MSTDFHPVVSTFRRAVWTLLVAALSASGAAPPVSALVSDGLIASAEPGWPQWRGARRDGISAETGLLSQWPDGGPPLLWGVTNIGTGWASPVVSAGTVFITGDVGNDLVVFAFDLAGALKWRTTNGAAWKTPYPGARSCGVIAAGRYYHMNAHGRVVCLDVRDGRERWAVDVLERFGGRKPTWAMSECLLVDGPRLIVTPCGDKALMAALDRENGATIWTTDALADELASYCSPLLVRHAGRRLLLNCTSHHAWAVDADTGRLLWKVPFHGRWSVTSATPVYADDAVFFSAPDGPEGQLHDLPVPPAVEPRLRWQTKVDALTGGTLLVGDRLYAHGCKNTKTLHEIDWKTGAETAVLPAFAARPASHASAAMIWAEGRIYALFDDGTVALLRPADNGFEVDGRFQRVEAKRRDAWAHPVLLDGRLYLRHHDTLWCHDVIRK